MCGNITLTPPLSPPLQGRGIDVAPRAGTCLQVQGVVSNGLIVYNCLKDSGKGVIS